MTGSSTIITNDRLAEIKQIPQEPTLRQAIRQGAEIIGIDLPRNRLLTPEQLEQYGRTVLDRLGQPESFLGFAMVALSNSFWAEAFAATPFHRRLFLLPHCLSDREACAGTYDTVGLHCAGCARCPIHDLKPQAERLGYQVIVAEGTNSVLQHILEGRSDALLGVACLDSLAKSFIRVAELGVPHLAVPLLKDGCTDTDAEYDYIRELLQRKSPARPVVIQSYVPLLRQTVRLFQEPDLAQTLGTNGVDHATDHDGLGVTERIALDWLRDGGKRLRPFVTLAAYTVARHGLAATQSDTRLEELIPPAVRALAIAIEALHKASLVHDDIEDNDDFRYGQQTIHRLHGIGPAVNIGDYLIGLGYRLITSQAGELGAECTSDILAELSHAHLELCRGQGAELFWQGPSRNIPAPLEVLTVYALKTAPAFEAALYIGLRAAGMTMDMGLLRRWCTNLGEGFQILNDLDDWRADDRNKVTRGADALSGRPTLLRALAATAGQEDRLLQLTSASKDPEAQVDEIRQIYTETGAFERAEQMFHKLRTRALSTAADFPTADLQQLARFLVQMVLPARIESPASESAEAPPAP